MWSGVRGGPSWKLYSKENIKLKFSLIQTVHTEDIDECSSAQICSPGENCVNTMGSFQCISACDLGFRLNSRSERCEDIDECAVGLAACFLGASCINTLGSYKCACGSGYKEVNGVCEDIGRSLGGFAKRWANLFKSQL